MLSVSDAVGKIVEPAAIHGCGLEKIEFIICNVKCTVVRIPLQAGRKSLR